MKFIVQNADGGFVGESGATDFASEAVHMDRAAADRIRRLCRGRVLAVTAPGTYVEALPEELCGITEVN